MSTTTFVPVKFTATGAVGKVPAARLAFYLARGYEQITLEEAANAPFPYVRSIGDLSGRVTVEQLVELLGAELGGVAPEQLVALRAALVGGAPELLDTLNELAAALGDDPDFAATVTTQLGLKQSKASLSADLATKLGLPADAFTLAVAAKQEAAIAAQVPAIVTAQAGADAKSSTTPLGKALKIIRTRPTRRMQQGAKIQPAVMATPAVVTVSAASAASFWASRSDTCGTATGSPTITDPTIVAADFGKPVSGTGIPANSYVGTVTPGVSFKLSSAPYPAVDRNATATNASTALTIGSTSQDIAYNSPLIAHPGGVPAVVLSQVGYLQNNILGMSAGAGPRYFPVMGNEFDTDSFMPEVLFYGANNYAVQTAFLVEVDGELTSLTAKVVGTDWAGSAAPFRIRIDLTPLGATKRMRRINIIGACFPFGGVSVGPNDTVAPPSKIRACRLGVISDSFSTNITGPSGYHAWPHMLGRAIGGAEVFVNGLGGSGYIVPGSGYLSQAGQNFYDRREGLKSVSPDVIVIAGGVNDAAQSASAIGAAATALYADLAADARTKDALVFVFGPWRGATFPVSPGLAGAQSAIKAAALAAPNVAAYFDPIDENWITGNGYYGTPSTTTPRGNSENVILSDALHPTLLGQENVATRMLGDINTVIEAG